MSKEFNARHERIALRIKFLLTGLGRVPESEIRAQCNYYPVEDVAAVIGSLIQEGFCERAYRGGTAIIMLTGAPLEKLMKEGGAEV